MMTLVVTNEEADLSRIVPVDYVKQAGEIVSFGAHEFGVFGHASHEAWEDQIVLGPGIGIRVYAENRCIMEYHT